MSCLNRLSTTVQPICFGSWLGFRFLDLSLHELTEVSEQEIAAQAARASGDGTLHYKYMPRTGEWGTADAEYAVLTPAHTPNRRVLGMWRAQGSVQWHRARWEDMPTQFNIVNCLADLEILENRGAVVTQTIGGKDLSDQRILK